MVLDKKGKGEEFKHALDQELVFKANIKRNKVVGKWVAENYLELSNEEIDVFVDKTVDSDFEEKGYEDVIRFFKKEFHLKNIFFDEIKIRKKMEDEFLIAYDKLK